MRAAAYAATNSAQPACFTHSMSTNAQFRTSRWPQRECVCRGPGPRTRREPPRISLYLASQGAGRLFWPLFYGLVRVFIAVVGGWATLRLTGSLNWMFAALALGLVVYGMAVAAAIRSGAWFRSSRADAH